MVKAPQTDKLAFNIYSSQEYRADLTKHIKATKKGDRILLTSMTIDPTEPAIHDLMEEVMRALRRGVWVTVGIDAHTFLVSKQGMGPLWHRKTMPLKAKPYFQNKLDIIHAINAAPTGRATILNKPNRRFSLPVAGRSHIKTAIVNDYAYVGGCNLEGSEWVDMMAGWQDKRSADWLHETMKAIVTGEHAGRALGNVDRGFKLDSGTDIFIDSGVRKQSIIFDEALSLIDSAQEWLVITGQYFPNSLTARHLLKAHKRGVKVEVVFSHPHHHGLIGGLGQHYSLLREKSRLPKALFKHALSKRDPFVHAKLIACDKGVMLGSHNYVQAGVLLGTAEIALRSADTKLAKEAVMTLHNSLRSNIPS